MHTKFGEYSKSLITAIILDASVSLSMLSLVDRIEKKE